MKLSEKGKAKIANLANKVYWDTRPSDANHAIEELVESLEANDFQGAVVLTVDEAKLIHQILDDCVWRHYMEEYEFSLDAFKERIEQVEKSND